MQQAKQPKQTLAVFLKHTFETCWSSLEAGAVLVGVLSTKRGQVRPTGVPMV